MSTQQTSQHQSAQQPQHTQQSPPILFIGGGNIATAIFTGLITSKAYQEEEIYVVDPTQSQLDLITQKFPQIHTSPQITSEIISKVTIILIATKPHVCPSVSRQLGPMVSINQHIIVSVCTGVTTQNINDLMTTTANPGNNNPEPLKVPVIRVMPNTPALVQAGVSGICRGEYATNEHLQLVSQVMSTVGLVIPIINENDMHPLTALSGSGPAYVITFIEALTAGGVAAGLTYPVSYQLALETVLGAATLLKQTGQHPAILREMICSPGGTTIAALKALHQGGFTHSVIQCVLDASTRSMEMANKAAKL